MTDDTAQTPTPPAGGSDALAQLEELLAKAKNSRGQSTDPADPALAPNPEAEAQAAAEAAQAQEAAMQAQIDQSETERKQALEEQQTAMVELEKTPQYQARVEQGEKIEEEKAAETAAHDGHQIVQITKTTL